MYSIKIKLIKYKYVICFFLLILFFFLYGYFFEINNICMVEETIKNEKLDDKWDGIKIAYFSDLNISDNINSLENISTKLEKNNFDIILFTGNFFKDNVMSINTKEKNKIIDIFRKIKAPLGKFFFLDNLNCSEMQKNEILNIFQEGDFQDLSLGEKKIYREDSTPIQLLSIPNNLSLDELNKISLDKNNTILITSNKYLLEKTILTNNNFLILSYGNYGGNIGIPFVNNKISNCNYNLGIKKINKDQTHINSVGIGINYNFKFRLFNDPKIYFIELRKN